MESARDRQVWLEQQAFREAFVREWTARFQEWADLRAASARRSAAVWATWSPQASLQRVQTSSPAHIWRNLTF